MNTIDEQIRVVLRSQAAAMRVPDSRPGQQMARVLDMPEPRRRLLLPMLAAASVLVLASIVALVQRDGTPDAVIPAAAAGDVALHFETPTVVLDAASLQVVADGRRSVPTADLRVDGDPGTFNEYTTLELTWHDGDIEQRVNMYFASDGVDWWATEIRTYDGQAHGEWVEPAVTGQFFKSPLGAAYTGDFDLANLHIEGMTLQAFRRPAACDNATSALALIADFPQIDAWQGAGFGATVQLVDTATCTPQTVAPFTFQFASDDPSIAAIDAEQNVIPDYPATKARVDLRLGAPGETTLHATARDDAGTIVGTADMHVTVRPGDAAGGANSGAAVPVAAPS